MRERDVATVFIINTNKFAFTACSIAVCRNRKRYKERSLSRTTTTTTHNKQDGWSIHKVVNGDLRWMDVSG